MNTKTKIKEVNGIEIFVETESGRFSATIPERGEIKRAYLRDVEREIEKISGAVVAYEFRYYERPIRVEVVGFEKDRPRYKDGRLGRRYDDLFLLDLEELAKLEDLSERLRRVHEEIDAIKAGASKLTSRNISEAREFQSKKS